MRSEVGVNRRAANIVQPHFLLVTGTLECGGSERQMAEMANYWAAEGVCITLATWTGPENPDFYVLDRRIRRVHLDVEAKGRLKGNLWRVLKFRKLLAETRPDAVLSFLTRSNVPAILACLGLKLRVVVSERVQPALEIGLPLGWRILRRLVYGQADEIACQTAATAEWIRRAWRLKTIVIPNALRPLPPPADERQPFVIAVGRLVRQKGFDLLLQAFARIAAEFPDWCVVIVGEGPERANLLRMRDELGLARRVKFVGHAQDVEARMAGAGLVVQPSRFEGFPNVVLEGMGMGAAVISADCPAGPSELIEDRVNGMLVPVDDVRNLAGVMAELMSQPALRSRLGREALKVRERFGQESIMARWKAVLLPQ